MNLQCTGPDKRREEFFRQLSTAYEMLAIFYAIPKERQEEMMAMFDKFYAEALERRKT